MKQFSSEIIKKLKFYVYLLSDPISGDIFYVGKGKGNRVFSHLKETNDKSEKSQKIRELRNQGKNPKIELHAKIPERFARPYEKKSWEQYKKLFIKESRIVAGVKFYSENKDLILKVSKKYGVDPFIILSIAGIESNYGKHYKGFTVFNSLYT